MSIPIQEQDDRFHNVALSVSHLNNTPEVTLNSPMGPTYAAPMSPSSPRTHTTTVPQPPDEWNTDEGGWHPENDLNSPYSSSASGPRQPNRQQHFFATSMQGNTSIGVSPAVLSIFAYFFMWFGGLLILSIEKKNLFVLLHAWQSFCCGVIAFVLQLIFFWSHTMSILLWVLYAAFTFIMILVVIKDVPNQTLTKLPFIGDWCYQRAIGKIEFYSQTSSTRYMFEP